MADQKKLDRWAEKLLDTGKRNNLINFRDSKASTAEILYPSCDTIFSKCSVGHIFDVFDPKITDEDEFEVDVQEQVEKPKRLTREEYVEKYQKRIRNEKTFLIYAQTPNPMTALKNVAKKAREMLDETGNNVAYLAFGFVRWSEKQESEVFYRAPLLLVHVNILTGAITDPIRIEVSDDDIIVNPTFSYMLLAQFGIKLPDFKEEDTLESYFRRVSTKVKKLGWEVISECKLGIFSFLKINMYEDIKKNAKKILKNPNVLALLGESDSYVGFSSDEIEHVVDDPLIDLHAVVNADSSQIEAIEMAKSGKSFVLQGPPGTGKSQTITNIIAECLYDGKRVLFVSEKQAALNVVFDKLKKAGLSDFCLELHSHKANKKTVINELNRTLEMPTISVRSSAAEEIRVKQDAKQRLDSYEYELHKKREGINKSLYQLFELYSSQREYPEIELNLSGIQSKGKTYYNEAIKYLEQYVEYIPSIGVDYRKNPWYGFNNTQISFDEKNQLRSDMETILNYYRKLQNEGDLDNSGVPSEHLNLERVKIWAATLDFAGTTNVFTPALYSREYCLSFSPVLEQLKQLSYPVLSNRTAVLSKCSPEILQTLNGKDLYTTLSERYKSFISRLGSGYKRIISMIQPLALQRKKLKYEEALEITKYLMDYQEALRIYIDNESSIRTTLGSVYCGPDTDWKYVFDSIETFRMYSDVFPTFFTELSNMSMEDYLSKQPNFVTRAQLVKLLTDQISLIQPNVTSNFNETQVELKANMAIAPINNTIQWLENCISEFDKLGNWNSFVDVMQHIQELELLPFIECIIDESIESPNIVGTFRRWFFKYWIEYIKYSVPEINQFSRVKQDQAVLTFSEKDKLQFEISKAQIQAVLSERRPKIDLVAGGSEVAVLRREGQKKRKQMPIRKLLDETSGLSQTLKPCFLMSPLSVSTYLDSGKITFDTVIFDEASQIFPQDAIGAIYRGTQLIVVGDSRQMPPTNFFSTSLDTEDDDEDVGDVTDFESILDICSSVFNTERLAWHYRSHYEQLIAFSNQHFYNNNLVTFPSASTDHQGIGVDYHYVNGIFDRKSKSNRLEAEYIVDLVFRNIEQYPDRSLGIVAFSMSQQSLIDKLLAKRREENPSFEWFFDSNRMEPFFIKNLETVQGDERDTIIFSVAYAKDSAGRFIQNFGPLNREGGERRLNVAVTRAKDNVQLVSSIHASDINLSNTESEGVRLLRAYLDFAQNGEVALERTISVSSEDQFDSYFEQEVCDYLRDNGFEVDTQVGCSGYRIDLGLRKPDSSDYLLAIECDGATYHSSKNARDRDSLRQSVLESMGWQFYRIWSTDWYRNKEVEKEKLLEAAKKAIDIAAVNDADISIDPSVEPDNEKETVTSFDDFTEEVEQQSVTLQEYKELDAMAVYYENDKKLLPAIHEILLTEAPLSVESLLKRIVSVYGREKVSKSVTEFFYHSMLKSEAYGIVFRDGFLYLKGQNTFPLRVPGDKREIKNIALEELASGLKMIIEQNIGVTKEGLFKTLINLLGFNRSGEAIVSRLDLALNYLIKKKIVREKKGQYYLV